RRPLSRWRLQLSVPSGWVRAAGLPIAGPQPLLGPLCPAWHVVPGPRGVAAQSVPWAAAAPAGPAARCVHGPGTASRV
ncbi:hypothetical protein T484DRAFT_1895123, partial [Baffinella frigidus]